MTDKLYYQLTVWDANKSAECKRFRILSGLPFPSPLDTELCISVEDTGIADEEDSFFVSVLWYEHRRRYDIQAEREVWDDMYMLLGVDEDDDLWSPSSGRDPSSTKAESIWKALINAGWEEIPC